MNSLCVTIKTISNLSKLTFLGPANNNDLILKTSRLYGLKTMFLGILYLLINQIGSIYFGLGTLLTPIALKWPFYYRFFYLIISAKISISKYLSVWLLNEATCIFCGISFNGIDAKDSKIYWNGLTNVKPLQFETPWSLNDLIASFNINTNHWVR